MYEPYATIFEDTKEIVIAKLESSNVPANADNGKDVAEFFEAVYNKLVEIAEKKSEYAD